MPTAPTAASRLRTGNRAACPPRLPAPPRLPPRCRTNPKSERDESRRRPSVISCAHAAAVWRNGAAGGPVGKIHASGWRERGLVSFELRAAPMARCSRTAHDGARGVDLGEALARYAAGGSRACAGCLLAVLLFSGLPGYFGGAH